jgi:hypothetical protein
MAGQRVVPSKIRHKIASMRCGPGSATAVASAADSCSAVLTNSAGTPSPEALSSSRDWADRLDALLDDQAFLAPFAPFFHPVIGRPSTPAEWYLRLMFLKFRYRLGYESLCAGVRDSVSWRRFCRIPLDGKVPHPTTLMKLTDRPPRCGTR